MAQQQAKKRLGRGLAALIGDDTTEEGLVEDVRTLRHMPIEFLTKNPRNPRRRFGEEDLADLAASVREKGLLQPIVVRPVEDQSNKYEIVAGERRWRAAQKAGIHEVPVIIRTFSDGEALEIALVENIQRADLNPIEEAQGYQQLIDHFGYTQQQLADSIGKSRSHIANTLRLLTLPEKIQTYLTDGSLTAGHARALVATDAPESIAEKIVKLGLSVRDAEDLARKPTDGKPRAKSKSNGGMKDADTAALEKTLTDVLG
ncbi:MAG: ParB/RepB/Spo0J family partition protein, partial [Hyphomicrobiales bacterium]